MTHRLDHSNTELTDDEPRLKHLVGQQKYDAVARMSEPDFIPLTHMPMIIRRTTVDEIIFPKGTIE